jgi:UDPglucose 6-dehydrogenase
MRDAPSLPLIHGLVSRGAKITAFDPEAMGTARALLPEEVVLARDAAQALTQADAVVLVTEWNEFRTLGPARLKQLMRGRIVVDLRNVFDPKAMHDAGFVYQGIGRPRHPDATKTASHQG